MNSIVHLPSMIWINCAAASIFRHPSFRFHCNNRLSSEWHFAFTDTYKWARIRNAVNENNIIKCFFFVNSYNLRMITHGSRVQKFECTRMIMSPMINGGARVSTIKCMKFICGESSYNIRSGRSWALQKSTFWNPRNIICSSAAEMLIRHCCEPISPLIWQIIILVCIVSMTHANITMSLTVMVIDRIRHQKTYNLNRNIENKIRKCKVHMLSLLPSKYFRYLLDCVVSESLCSPICLFSFSTCRSTVCNTRSVCAYVNCCCFAILY